MGTEIYAENKRKSRLIERVIGLGNASKYLLGK
jgi:hypothetical protein